MKIPVLKSSIKKKPDVIIFDWDNTLVDTWPVIADSLNAALSAFDKKPWTMQQVKTKVKHSLRDSFPTLFGQNWKSAAKIFYKRFEMIHTKLLCPIKGIPEMLDALTESGIQLSIVSNKRGDYLRNEIDFLNWCHYFNNIVGANDAEFDKPSVKTIEMALKYASKSENINVWFVGDSNIDMECAINSGCIPILLRKNPPFIDEFKDFKPTLHFLNGRQLCEKLKSLNYGQLNLG